MREIPRNNQIKEKSKSLQDTNETIKYWRGLKVRKEPKKKTITDETIK